MLITEKVIMKWNSNNKKYFVERGYEFAKMGYEFEVKIEDLTKNSKILVEVKCDCDDCENPYLTPMTYYSYTRSVKNDGLYYCSKCTKSKFNGEKARLTRLKNSKSFEQWCIENDKLEYLNLWDYELNDKLPSEVNYTTKSKYYFKCPRGLHESELKRIQVLKNGSILRCNRCNSFAQWGIDNIGEDFLKKYWDFDKNISDPWIVSCNCEKFIWIYCQEKDYHGSYKIRISDFNGNHRCGYCNNRKVHPKDSLGQYIVDNYGEDFLNQVWSDKNNKSPFEYSPKSKQKVWWKCLDNIDEDYEKDIDSSNNNEFRCPECFAKYGTSIIQSKTNVYLEELGYVVNHENKCSLVIDNIIEPPNKNPKKKRLKGKLKFDNEIILDNGKHLFIEVMGGQHYFICYWHEKQAKIYNISPNEELKYLQDRDKYKKQCVINKGHNYLELPYISFKNNNYKQLIDDKINEILNENNKIIESEMI